MSIQPATIAAVSARAIGDHASKARDATNTRLGGDIAARSVGGFMATMQLARNVSLIRCDHVVDLDRDQRKREVEPDALPEQIITGDEHHGHPERLRYRGTDECVPSREDVADE